MIMAETRHAKHAHGDRLARSDLFLLGRLQTSREPSGEAMFEELWPWDGRTLLLSYEHGPNYAAVRDSADE